MRHTSETPVCTPLWDRILHITLTGKLPRRVTRQCHGRCYCGLAPVGDDDDPYFGNT